MLGQWAKVVYAIDDFPDDDLLWRIEWIGGVGYNTSVPSDPLMDVCMAQLPARNESAECEIALLSNKENRKNRRGPIALHLDWFSMATAAACVNEPRC